MSSHLKAESVRGLKYPAPAALKLAVRAIIIADYRLPAVFNWRIIV